MAKIITFKGRNIIEPGALAQVLGGETDPPDAATFGNALIIDTGKGAGFGFGSGIVGDHESGLKSIYRFNSLEDFREGIRGGIFWDVAKWLFKPSKDVRVKGVDAIYLVQAKTTTKSTFEYVWVGGGANGGNFKFSPITEGVGGNGVINGTSLDLETGFASKMIAGVIDPTKFVVEFFKGTFTGNDEFGVPFNNILAEDSISELLARSPEFDNIQELIDWSIDDFTFNLWFIPDPGNAKAGTGLVDAADLAANLGLKVTVGGTDSFTAADLDLVFKAIKETDYTFILSDNYEDDADDLDNSKILAHIDFESEFDRFLIIGGGKDETKFDQADGSLLAAALFDDQRVHIVHSRTEKAKDTGTGFREYPTIYHAAAILGRMAGDEPQVPITWTDLDFDGVVHEMNQEERERAIQGGVIHQRFVEELGLVVNQDINSKQRNDRDIFEDGTSPHGSIMRIAFLLNKELTKNLRVRFIPRQNANTASPADVKAFVEGYLASRTATKTDDNLILSSRNVKVELRGSDYFVTYGFVPNGPINRFFITGFMFPVSSSI